MTDLNHLIYTSTATRVFDDQDLIELLLKARENNQRLGLTGMLLYTQGSFFQVLEGKPAALEELFQSISRDERHTSVTTIIREPIPKRSFGDWTMGYATISPEEVIDLVGLNDFFGSASCFSQLNSGRAKKLLFAFKEGRWRSKLIGASSKKTTPELKIALPSQSKFSFAFQPIINATQQTTVSYEALIRGLNNEPASEILKHIGKDELYQFDERCRKVAIGLAAQLGLNCNLNLHFLPMGAEKSVTSIPSTLEVAERYGIQPERIILEISSDEMIEDHTRFAKMIEPYRQIGIKVAIDNFGAGHSSLSLLDQYQPEFIALNVNLIKNVDSNGPRQAIFRGIAQTCFDLGVDIIAKGIETPAEYQWFRSEGVELFQGDLFAPPAFEKLPIPAFPAA